MFFPYSSMCLLLVLCVLNSRADRPVGGGDAASSVQLPEDAPWVDENQVNALPGDGPSVAQGGDKTIAGRTTPSPSHAGASAHDAQPNIDVAMGVDADDSPPPSSVKFAPARSGV